MIKTAIATVCLSGTLSEKLKAIAAAGFKAVEIFESDLIAFSGTPEEVKAICADLDLAIITYQPFRDFEGMPRSRRDGVFHRAERKFEVMNRLGCDLMLVCSSVAPDAEGGIDRLAADFHELGTLAARHDIRVGYEALAWGRHISDYRDALEVARRADHANIGTILDTFHIQSRGTDLATIRSIPKERIFLVQVADAPLLKMDLLSWSRHWRCMPYQGDFDLSAFMAALLATGYNGYLSLEIFNDRFRAGSARAVAVDGHRSLITLMDDAARQRCNSSVSLNPVAMPARAPVQSVAFIEFTVHERDRAGFEALLSQLGFVRTGRHRSKDVALFAQGSINLIVNCDRQGFAHSYQISHGTSVCALALMVPSASDIVKRAKSLLDEPHVDAIGPGELDLPAFRGVGGSLIYLIDQTSPLARWSDVDFVPTGEPAASIGLKSVDHISQSMHYEEMLTWLLFYTSLLQSVKMPMQELIDPGGVVLSQVIESGLGDQPHDGLRLILNGSQSHRTMASKFVTDFFGSGVQHIAFDTDDIFATMEKLVHAGVDILPVPQNYYDDLDARFCLGEAELARLKSLNILYDTDQSGIFYHAYTKALDGGFFFEIVQRGQYRGYGAPNSGIRLAAQARFARAAGMPRL